MRAARLLALLVSVSMLGLPAVVLTAGPANAAETTRVAMDVSPNKKMAYNYGFSITGQVLFTHAGDGETYSVDAGGVQLQRKLAGTKRWSTIRRDSTAGDFYFYPVAAKANATYRVVYAGATSDSTGLTFGRSSSSREVSVSRRLHDRAVKENDRLMLKGKVAPVWKHRPVFVERKTCMQKRCKWQSYTKVRTNAKSQFTARVRAPRSGSWFYRARVNGTIEYVTSYSSVYRAYSL
jgi:hypothetical protein